ncbi:hypothetical protein KLSP111695_22880 [Klebsiella spallanzanii]
MLLYVRQWNYILKPVEIDLKKLQPISIDVYLLIFLVTG